jgi:hypothetical protein
MKRSGCERRRLPWRSGGGLSWCACVDRLVVVLARAWRARFEQFV